MDKSELRKILKSKILNQDTKLIKKKSLILNNFIRFWRSIDTSNIKNVSVYYSLPGELDTLNIIKWLISRSFTVVLPKVIESSRVLKFSKINKNIDIEYGILGTKESMSNDFIDPDILIIPMLGFDRNGNRLGRGGGYYDNTIAMLRKKYKFIIVGLAFSFQEVDHIEIDTWDEKLDYIVTEKGYYSIN